MKTLTLKQAVYEYVHEQCPEAIYESDNLQIFYGRKFMKDTKGWPYNNITTYNTDWLCSHWGNCSYYVSMHNFTVEIAYNTGLGCAIKRYLETTKNWDPDDLIEVNEDERGRQVADIYC